MRDCYQNSTYDDLCIVPNSITTGEPVLPSEIFILVIRNSEAYVISGDGNSKVSATITAPNGNYFQSVQHALIRNQLYIFGGSSDKRKIAVLEACSFKEKSERLLNDIDWASAALSIDDDSRGK
ncbi:Oidioi.mRNA.OKI2018_I69.chr2.g5403.t1.cds [Oikopleura dioica]|uniref:Oidioi.mRNA.OKI2018_I69.chr2.g5403.t1.cds n=1 Tax=Oikopleura dioica TaxID=34765 RepID=A0ABN7T1X2_OIKDI|nr:Oidioi.mRNA.OKI2018_I69.chr2.g5403.t1.cds [Oikopleura dioica]